MKGKYFSLHHRFLAWLGKRTNTIILSPNPVSIGNASEDYLFGLIKARLEGRKLVILFPYSLPWPFRQPTFDPAIFYLESDLLALKFRSPLSCLLSFLFSVYFLLVVVFQHCLVKIFGIETNGYYFRPLAGQDLLWRPSEEQVVFDWELLHAQNWEEQISEPPQLSLPGKMLKFCEVERERIGLPQEAWFVCLHVRDGGYKGDFNNVRNANIENYMEAITEITRRGGWVIRMGDRSMQELPICSQVIDYAHSSSLSSTMDVYLIKGCAFYVGTSSGHVDTALLFGKPVVHTNMTHWINLMPMRKGDILIFKHVYSKSLRSFISIQEWMQQASLITSDFSSTDWEFVENSSEELAEVVAEYMDYRGKTESTQLQNEFRKAHARAVHELSKIHRFGSSDVENCNEWFRFGSRMLSWKGEVSAKYLEKNWLQCSRSSK